MIAVTSSRWLTGLVLVSLMVMRPALAAEDGGVTGVLINATTGDPIVGHEVVLHTFREADEAGKVTATTQAGGRFSFGALQTGEPWSYVVQTTYQEADYESSSFEIASGETKDVELLAYDATGSPENLTITEWVVWLDRRDGLVVQQDLQVLNAGTTTFVGDEALPGGKKAVLRLPISADAGDLQYLGIFMECCAFVRGPTFVHTMAIPPGTSEGTFSHRTAFGDKLAFPVALPTASFTILAPQGAVITSAHLRAGATTESQGNTYRAYTATDLAPGTTIDVMLGGLEPAGIPPVAIALFAVAAVAAASLVLLLLRPRALARLRAKRLERSAARTEPGEARRPPAAEAAAPGRETVRVPQNADEYELLVEEIAALDLAYEKGLLAEQSYRRLRGVAKERLVALALERRDPVSR